MKLFPCPVCGMREGHKMSCPEGFKSGQKFDQEKPRMHLIPPLMEIDVADVLTFGAQKYSEDNWRKVDNLENRYLSAAMRHINAIRQGENFDGESGHTHAAHAVCCLMFLGEIQLEDLQKVPFA